MKRGETMKKLMLALLSCALVAPAMAADPVKARKDVFEQYKKTVGPMSKVIKGETPFNKDEFAKMAAHLDELAQQPYLEPIALKAKLPIPKITIPAATYLINFFIFSFI